MAIPTSNGHALTRRGMLLGTAGTLLASASACGRAGARGGEVGAHTDELVIGASLELTGAGAAMAVPQERALQITLETLNEKGVPTGDLRRTVRMVIRDNLSDPRIAARDAVQLADQDNVHALLGGAIAETSLAMVTVAQQRRIPFVSLAAADTIVLPPSRRTHVFKLAPDAADVADRIARLLSAQKLERVALMASAGSHGDSGVEAVPIALRTAQRTLIRVVRLPASGDIGPAAQRVTDSDPHAVVVWATAPMSGAAARALRAAGYEGQIVFDAGGVTEETLSPENERALEGSFVVHPLSLSGSSLTNTTSAALARRDLVFRYIQRHGSFSGFAPYASDAIQLIATAARVAGSVDREQLRSHLETQVTEGIVGAYAFTPARHGGMEPDSLGVFTVSQGAWSRIS